MDIGSGLHLDGKGFKQLLDAQLLVDCTLACDGGKISAHKIVLSACSSYLARILLEHPVEHPIIILPELDIEDVRTLVHYMYTGELLKANSLHSSNLLRTAAILSVNSLNDLLGGSSPSAAAAAAAAMTVATAIQTGPNQPNQQQQQLAPSSHSQFYFNSSPNYFLAGSQPTTTTTTDHHQLQQQQQSSLTSSSSTSPISLINDSINLTSSNKTCNSSNYTATSNNLSKTTTSSSDSSPPTTTTTATKTIAAAAAAANGVGGASITTTPTTTTSAGLINASSNSKSGFQFKCPVCQNDFQTICSFEYHMQRIHNVTSFGCEICHKPFASLRYVLLDHMNRCHGTKPIM